MSQMALSLVISPLIEVMGSKYKCKVVQLLAVSRHKRSRWVIVRS